MSPTQEPSPIELAARQARCMDEVMRISAALRDCGCEVWSVSESKENPYQFTLMSSNDPGRWWFYPGFVVGQPYRLLLPVDAACRVINEYAEERWNAGAHPDLCATEDDALELWQRLCNLAESLASGGVL